MFGDPRQLPSSVLADQSARGSGAPHLTSVSGGTQDPSVPPRASALPGEMRAVRAQGRHCGTDNISLQFLLKIFFCILNSHEAIGAAFHTYSPSQGQATPKLTAVEAPGAILAVPSRGRPSSSRAESRRWRFDGDSASKKGICRLFGP